MCISRKINAVWQKTAADGHIDIFKEVIPYIWGRKGFDGGQEAGKASGGRDLLNTRILKLSANDTVYAAA